MTPRLIAALALLAGCAPATVDTVQPNAVQKDTFEGEWYWRRTVAEVPYGTATTFTGAQTELERVRWKVEEDYLLGYRSYEGVDAADAPTGVGVEDGAYYGAPLLAYRIDKHFDIRRRYDPSTGEESNVIEENTERPWYERDFMRVDWSTNAAEAGWNFAGVELKVLDFATNDPGEEGAPQLDDTDGDGVVDSMLLTSQVLAEPDAVTFPGYGDVPVCFLYGRAQYECAATEVTLLSSFLRVDPGHQYEGQVHDDAWMETFGYFSTEKLQYDRAYGIVEPNRQFWTNRHNLWETSWRTDGMGRAVCTSGEQTLPCEAFSVDDQVVPEAIPYAEREVAQIAIHAGPDFPSDFVRPMEELIVEWNEPFRDTVNELRFWECIDADGEVAACSELRDPELEVVVFCPNNPSRATDPEVCSTDHTGPSGRPDGVPDLAVPGDLRYHFVHVVDNPHLSSPFGYGPSAADPVGSPVRYADGTRSMGAGEIISGNAFLYGSVLDRVAHQTADLVQLLNGDVDPESFIDGEDVEAWVVALREGSADQLAGRTDGRPDQWTRDEVARAASHISNGFGVLLRPTLGDAPRPTDPASFRAFMDAAEQALDGSGAFGAGAAETLGAFEALVDSPFDDLMWSDETVGSYGYDPVAMLAGDSSALAGRSPLDLVHPADAAEREHGRILAGSHAVDLEDGSFSDSALLGLARSYADRGWTYDEIVADVREQTFKGVVLHELGHTFGLRHNFAGSFDAMNFASEYWALRDDGDMGPRHVDPETDAEIDGRIREYQSSTVMDYPGSRVGDWHGLGHYDHASVKFGYGALIETFAAVPTAPAIPDLPNDLALAYVGFYTSSDVYPSPLLWNPDGSMVEIHYTDYPAMAGDLEARVDVPLSKLRGTVPDEIAMSSGLVVSGKVKGAVAKGAPAVPYRFCSDEFAIGMTCSRWDEGADPYEVQQYTMERYFSDYVLNNFSRGRYGFGSGSYLARIQDRTFEPLRVWQRYYALFHGIFDVEGDTSSSDFFAADKGFGGWTAATDESFGFLTQVVLRPEPGPHGLVDRPDGVRHLAPDSFAPTAEIPLVAGAWYESDWDYTSGYHWFDRQSRVGTYWDRMLALMALTNTSSYGFLGYDTSIDPRAYSIGYQDLYRDEIALFLGQLMSDELGLLGPVLESDGTLTYPDISDVQRTWPPEGREEDRVQPAAYWLVQYDAGLFGKALLARGYDRSFLNRSRIYVDGSAEAIRPPQGMDTVRFTDPFSRKTYVAWSFPATDDAGVPILDASGAEIELGSGARMLRRANELLSLCAGNAMAPYTDPGDPESVEDQVALTCADLERFAGDIDLQLQIYKEFDTAAQ